MQSSAISTDKDNVSDRQTSNTVMMVRPACFGFNPEAARSNAFAKAASEPDIAGQALSEFDRLAGELQRAGIEVLTLEDLPAPAKPDAVFPNNWVSFHGDGTLVLYPMATAARRLERDPERLLDLLDASGFAVARIVDLTGHERAGRFLEGTGSLVLDRPARKAFAALGPRTSPDAVAAFESALGYETIMFDAADPGGQPIYHTNVLLSLGTEFALLCLECIPEEQRNALIEAIEVSGRTLIAISFEQLQRFGCNAIELRNAAGQPLIALSTAALNSFTPDQRRALESFGELLHCEVPTIEQIGGGGVRCMIAEIHLPRR